MQKLHKQVDYIFVGRSSQLAIRSGRFTPRPSGDTLWIHGACILARQLVGMSDPKPSCPYRVRTLTHGEQVAEREVSGPRFSCLDAAQRYASTLVNHDHLSVIVEKLAPGGCWLPLVS